MSDALTPEQCRFRFVAEYGQQVVSVVIPADTNLSDTLDSIEVFLIAAGFNAEQVRESFK